MVVTMIDDAVPAGEGTPLVQSVDRALAILETIAASHDDVGVTELAQQMGVHKSTVSRLVATLEARDLVEQQQDRGKYRLGMGILRLAAAANQSLDIVRVARPAMRELSKATGETVNLAVSADLAALYVDQLSGRSTLQSHSWVGQRVPVHATSNGKVLLAWADDPDLVERVLERGLTRYTPRTIVSRAALKREIELTRSRGWACAVDELEEGLTAIAAPVFDADDAVVASISVSGPGFRIDERLEEFAAAAVAAGAQASARLGHRAP